MAITDDVFVLLPEYVDIIIICLIAIMVFVAAKFLRFQDNIEAIIGLSCTILMMLGIIGIINTYFTYISIFVIIVMIYVKFKPLGGIESNAVD